MLEVVRCPGSGTQRGSGSRRHRHEDGAWRLFQQCEAHLGPRRRDESHELADLQRGTDFGLSSCLGPLHICRRRRRRGRSRHRLVLRAWSWWSEQRRCPGLLDEIHQGRSAAAMDVPSSCADLGRSGRAPCRQAMAQEQRVQSTARKAPSLGLLLQHRPLVPRGPS